MHAGSAAVGAARALRASIAIYRTAAARPRPPAESDRDDRVTDAAAAAPPAPLSKCPQGIQKCCLLSMFPPPVVGHPIRVNRFLGRKSTLIIISPHSHCQLYHPGKFAMLSSYTIPSAYRLQRSYHAVAVVAAVVAAAAAANAAAAATADAATFTRGAVPSSHSGVHVWQIRISSCWISQRAARPQCVSTATTVQCHRH
eukprot:COSAG05_NODE_28_length_29121_cov_56.951933_23_plen_199_part_00